MHDSMNRTSLVGILVTATVFAGLLFLFPAQWAALLSALVAWVTGQVILLRRRITVLPAPGGAVAAGGRARRGRRSRLVGAITAQRAVANGQTKGALIKSSASDH